LTARICSTIAFAFASIAPIAALVLTPCACAAPPAGQKAPATAKQAQTKARAADESKPPATLPPLDHRLDSGKPFDKRIVGPSPVQPIWIKIPPWLAGTWRTVSETRIWSRNEKTGKIDRTELTHDVGGLDVFGKQMDSEGAIWDLVPAYKLNIMRAEGKVVLRHTRAFKVVSVEPSAVTFEDRAIQLTLDPPGKTILGASQELATYVYRPLSGQRLEVTRTVSVYTPAGKLFRTLVIKGIPEQFKGFEPLDLYKGRDLNASFQEFMQARARSAGKPGSGSPKE